MIRLTKAQWVGRRGARDETGERKKPDYIGPCGSLLDAMGALKKFLVETQLAICCFIMFWAD